MSESHVPPPALSEQRAGALEATRWTAGRIVAVVIGSLLALVSLALLGGGGMGVWAAFQRDGGFVTTDVHEFSTPGSALATERVQLGSSGVAWLYAPSLLGKVRIRVTPLSSEPPLFVGIGRTVDVDRYLAGVSHTVITDYWGGDVEAVGGARPRSAPAEQRFWVASTAGRGTRTLLWKPTDGSWTVVAMNANGEPGINVGTDLGARVPALPWITVGLFVAGAVFLAGGALLIVGAIRRRNAAPAAAV